MMTGKKLMFVVAAGMAALSFAAEVEVRWHLRE